MEITTYPLETYQLEELIPFMTSFFKGLESIEVMYGWECNSENQYEYFPVSFQDLEKLIMESIKKKIFILGKSDLYIRDKKNKIEILFCHESDIHLNTLKKSLLNKMKNKIKEMDINFTVAKKGKLNSF